MDAIKNYKNIVKDIFNQDLNISNNIFSNNCISALNSGDNHKIFKENYIRRLERIYNFFKDDSHAIKNIVATVSNVAIAKGYKWSGAYSELVALDYLIQCNDLQNIKYINKSHVNSFPNSIAKLIGQTEIDLDISFDLNWRTKVYMDVKSLIPTHLELVDQLLEKVYKAIGSKDYLIAIDDLFEVDYLQTKKDYIYEFRSGTLISRLKNCINQKEKYFEHPLQSGNKAKFRISYRNCKGEITSITQRQINPYQLANDYKYKLLDYYKKLLIDEPSFITFVVNPWFNKEMNDFDNFNGTFYRALSRRVFIELAKNTDDMGIYYPDMNGKNIKICDVTGYITGIIFIEDKSILNTGKDLYKTYIFTNPNAKNKVLRKDEFHSLYNPVSNQNLAIDDFNYDNY